MTKYAFAINVHRCIGCRTCVVSCKMENGTPDGFMRMRVLNEQDELVNDVPVGEYPQLSLTWHAVPCQHCDMPLCVAACPTGASTKRDDGIVTVDRETCIGCGSCVDACPYDVRFINPDTNVSDKCDLCAHRLDAGETTTMCQLCCPGRAITVGDLDDPDSEVSKILAGHATTRLLEEEGTEPNVYYWNSLE